jgi:predicted nucleic acid-binding protein
VQAADGTQTLVIDCSLTMAWYFKDEATPYTNAVRAAMAAERAVVPAIWALEVANVLLTGERRKRSTQAKAVKWLRFLAALPITIDTDTPFRAFDPALGLARLYKLTAYDAAYLELAMRLGLPLATLDGDLENAARANGVTIYAPQQAMP